MKVCRFADWFPNNTMPVLFPAFSSSVLSNVLDAILWCPSRVPQKRHQRAKPAPTPLGVHFRAPYWHGLRTRASCHGMTLMRRVNMDIKGPYLVHWRRGAP